MREYERIKGCVYVCVYVLWMGRFGNLENLGFKEASAYLELHPAPICSLTVLVIPNPVVSYLVIYSIGDTWTCGTREAGGPWHVQYLDFPISMDSLDLNLKVGGWLLAPAVTQVFAGQGVCASALGL